MWLFTKLGFFSVTMSRQEPDKMQIRSRERQDLKALIKSTSIGAQILETAHSDYRFRIILPVEAAAQVMTTLISQIDYSNFKSAVEANPAQKHKARALHEIWAIMYQFQNRKPARPAKWGGPVGGPRGGPVAGPVDPKLWDFAIEDPTYDKTGQVDFPAKCPFCYSPLKQTHQCEPGLAWCGECQDYQDVPELPTEGTWKHRYTHREVVSIEHYVDMQRVQYRYAGPGRPKWYADDLQDFLRQHEFQPGPMKPAERNGLVLEMLSQLGPIKATALAAELRKRLPADVYIDATQVTTALHALKKEGKVEAPGASRGKGAPWQLTATPVTTLMSDDAI